MTDSATLSYVAELKREFQSLRTEMHEGFASVRLSSPNAPSSAEFLALFQAHRGLGDEVRSLREEVGDLRRRVEALENK
jgi:polyhydroxyalkanoate synthesis regulator phasin